VSARRNLSFWAALYGLGARESAYRIDALLARVGLGDRADEPVERYSRGMKQRLHLARGLLHDPAVLFLDEPTTGMDPVAARDLRSLVREVTGDGRTVLLTTHDMAEAEALCDNVSLIDRGRLLLSGPTADVAGHLGVREWVTFASTDRRLVAELGELSQVDEVIADTERDGEWRVRPASPAAIGAILIWLVERGVLTARCDRPSLEEVYLRVVGSRGMTV
jgi:ABC-2 type transport system ATP-binding protein